jgi:hypothetical protein
MNAWAQNAGTTLNAVFVGLQGGPSIVVKLFGTDTNTALKIEDDATLDMLRMGKNGDWLTLVVDDTKKPSSIKGVTSIQRDRGFLSTLAYMIAAVIILLAFGLVVTRFRLRALIIGGDNRYSTSKFQMAAWFFVLFTVYLACILMLLTEGWLNYLVKIAMPQNLAVLSGLSALTYGAAKAITVTKIECAKDNSPAYLSSQDGPTANASTPAQQIAANKVISLKVAGADRFRLRDLVTDDEGCVDLGDSQALFITLLALIIYLISGYAFLSHLSIVSEIRLPDVDTALLSLFGLGQGAYLAKKAVSPAGKG